MNELLFYQNIVALDRKKHHDLTLTTPINLDFAANTNFIPILLSELSEVAQELPVLFVPIGENEYALAAITGVQAQSNLLIQEGSWRGRYIPAFLRRYPFITLANPGDTSQFTIAIDEQAACLQGKKGASSGSQTHAIFEKDQPSKKLQELIPFLQKFHQDNQQTYAFCKRLQELNLLSKFDLGVQDRFGKKYQVAGGWLIDEDALKTLDPQLVQEFFANSWLQKIYQIQFSIRNFPLMLDRFGMDDSSQEKPSALSAPAKKSLPVQAASAAKKAPAPKSGSSSVKASTKAAAPKKTVATKAKTASKKTGKK